MAHEIIKRVGIDCPKISIFQTDLAQISNGIFEYILEHQNWDLVLTEPWVAVDDGTQDNGDLFHQHLDGLIFPGENEKIFAKVRKHGIPAVDYTGYKYGSDLPTVQPDNVMIGKMAFEHFCELGFRDYAYIGPENRIWACEREESFRCEVESAGYSYATLTPHYEIQNRKGWIALDTLVEWIQKLPKPVAIFSSQDAWASGIYHACQVANIEIPFEAAILGVDNSVVICETNKPKLSSIECDFVLQGYRTAQLLDKLMGDPNFEDVHQHIPPKYVVKRASTDVRVVEDPAVSQAMQFISEHYAEPVSVPDVAKASGISQSQLGIRFKSIFKHTIGEELRRIRLHHAKTLMLDTKISLANIASSVGFCDVQHFVKTFTKHEGISPAAWRKQHKS